MDMRHYDPAIARWVVQDPVLHYEYSPYQAFDNNLVFWADPSGADSWTNNGASNYYEYYGNISFGMNETGFSAGGVTNNTEGDGNNNDKKKKTTTDAGHEIDGSNNPKVDPGTLDGENYEKDYALIIEEAVNFWLSQWNIDNQRTREGDLTIDENSIDYRWKLANEHGSIVFVSFHLNSGSKDEVFTVYQQGKGNEEESKKLGLYIMNNLSSMTVSPNPIRQVNGYTTFTTLGVLNNFNGNAGVLIELGGIGNASNRQNITNNSSKIGKQIATGIYRYLNNGDLPPLTPVSGDLQGY